MYRRYLRRVTRDDFYTKAKAKFHLDSGYFHKIVLGDYEDGKPGRQEQRNTSAFAGGFFENTSDVKFANLDIGLESSIYSIFCSSIAKPDVGTPRPNDVISITVNSTKREHWRIEQVIFDPMEVVYTCIVTSTEDPFVIPHVPAPAFFDPAFFDPAFFQTREVTP